MPQIPPKRYHKLGYGDAKPLFPSAFRQRTRRFGPERPRAADMRDRLVTLYEAWNRPEEVEKWRAILLEEGGTGR